MLLGLGVLAAGAALAIGDSSLDKLLALVLFGGLCALTLRYPLVALSLLIVMTVSNLSSNLILGFGAPSVAKLAAPGMMALLIVRLMFWGDRPYVGWLSLWFFCGLLGLKLFGATYAADDWSKTLKDCSDFLKDAIVALLALAFLNYRNGFQVVVASAALTVAFICGLGLIQVLGVDLPGAFWLFARFGEYNGRFAGPIEDENFFAVVVVFCIPLALAQLLEARNTRGVTLWGLTCALLFFGLLATQSRGGILSLCVGLCVLFAQLSRGQKVGAVVASILVVIAASFFIGDEAFERLATLGSLVSEEGVDKSTEGRLASWTVAAEIFRSYPWMGVGAGNFNLLYQDIALEKGLIFRGEGRSTHSLYLEVLTEQGLIGLMFFLGFLAAAARGVWRANRIAHAAGDRRLALQMAAFGAGLLGYLTGMAFLHDAYPRFLWIVLVMAIEADGVVLATLPPPKEGDMSEEGEDETAPVPSLLLTGDMRVS
ncbi:putative O-glycosylation ligase, exosortase A-associated [Tritonibacter multivorans]|uniref:Putative O-glycosylation ligase, exosortase A-associated n=2 Tax=Tritonibacter multivorans TaxID=928856 RepID=A0A0P1GRK0_9RHOB|nr:O-antigen ligase family protein [Tritonibacter multivorans]MDA7422258.1 O-antigen ligase family protein [Tritonibacter multivorans]CUH77804.1 putative O-glycosylation ligase, exosortase A-associated [Tritonibacter multivorans]SFD11450.1 O-antigen ligase [Tritonibacter multivorans]